MVSNCQLIEWISPISIVRASVLVSEKSKQSRMDPSRPFAAIFLHCNHTTIYNTKQYSNNPYHTTLSYCSKENGSFQAILGHFCAPTSDIQSILLLSQGNTTVTKRSTVGAEERQSRRVRCFWRMTKRDVVGFESSTLLMINQSGLRTAAFCLLTCRTCSNALFFFQYRFIFWMCISKYITSSFKYLSMFMTQKTTEPFMWKWLMLHE